MNPHFLDKVLSVIVRFVVVVNGVQFKLMSCVLTMIKGACEMCCSCWYLINNRKILLMGCLGVCLKTDYMILNDLLY